MLSVHDSQLEEEELLRLKLKLLKEELALKQTSLKKGELAF